MFLCPHVGTWALTGGVSPLYCMVLLKVIYFCQGSVDSFRSLRFLRFFIIAGGFSLFSSDLGSFSLLYCVRILDRTPWKTSLMS